MVGGQFVWGGLAAAFFFWWGNQGGKSGIREDQEGLLVVSESVLGRDLGGLVGGILIGTVSKARYRENPGRRQTFASSPLRGWPGQRPGPPRAVPAPAVLQ